MIDLKKIVTGVTFAALIPSAYASIPDCTDTQGGTIDPLLNLVSSEGCYIYASSVEPTSTAKSTVKLFLPKFIENQLGSSPATAVDIIAAMDRLVVFSPGYSTNTLNSPDFTNYNDLKLILGKDDNESHDGFGVLAVSQQDHLLGYTVEDSAYALQAALVFINSKRPVDASKMAVLGFSLGGITARYALADMEEKNIEHNASLYISNEAPHRGAHIPQGIQQILPVMEEFNDDVAGLSTSISNLFNTWGVTISFSTPLSTALSSRQELADQASEVLYSEVGKQLIIDHISGTTEYNNLMLELAYLGYPAQTTNIAITNGSVLGAEQPAPVLNENGAFYEFFGKVGDNVSTAYFGARFALYPTEAGEKNLDARFSGWVQRSNPCPWPLNMLTCTNTYDAGVPKSRTTPSGTKELDRVPGSLATLPTAPYYATPGQFLAGITATFFEPVSDVVAIDHAPTGYNFTFIPTYSSLDIDTPYPSAALDIDESPFDYVYINGDRNFNDVKDNIDHLTVHWPLDVVNKIGEATNHLLNNEHKLLLWFSQGSPSILEIEELVRAAIGVPAPTPLPPTHMLLPTMLSFVVQHDTIASLEDLYFSDLYGMPTGLTPATLLDMVAQMDNEEIELELDYNDCMLAYDQELLCRTANKFDPIILP